MGAEEISSAVPRELGPYDIVAPISRGGGGVVYRAKHRSSGDVVALKALYRVAPVDQQTLRREIFTLSRLTHPGIVRLLDHGFHEGLPWYAMELLDGPTLQADWAAAQEPPRLVIPIVAQLCETLAFLHGEGIVHRDLKPANIVLRQPQQPVLVDFGLATRFASGLARESLQAGGDLSGTIDYMAPEQFRGEFVDARADLFSLGCILYEGLTRQPAFVFEDRDLLTGRLAAPPRSPSHFVRDLPHHLDALVGELLDNEPERRPGYADDVRRFLQSVATRPTNGRRLSSRPYLYRSRLAGRDGALAAIDRQLVAARSGHDAFVLVVGESGAGKTRLVMEVTRRALHHRFSVFAGECQPPANDNAPASAGGPPMAPLGEVLRAIADRLRSETPETRLDLPLRNLRSLAAYEPAFATLPGFAALPPLEALDGDAASARVLGDLLEALRALARCEPILLAIDDIQWADDLTLTALRAIAAGALRGVPAAVVAVARNDEGRTALDELRRSPGVTEVPVGRLDADSIEAMTGDMLAMHPPPATLLAMLLRESEGNPFFVGEYLRAAVGAELLERHDGRWRLNESAGGALRVALPPTLQEVVGRRLDQLPADAATLVTAAAVLGRQSDASVLAVLAGLDEARYLTALTVLITRQILAEPPEGGVRFVHDKLREVAYSRISATRRVTLHRQAAESLEAGLQGRPEAGKTTARLANHWALAGNAPRALALFDQVAADALRIGAYGDADAALRRARALDDGAASGRMARAVRARMSSVAEFGIADLDESIRHGEAALRHLGLQVPAPGAVGPIVAALADRIGTGLRRSWRAPSTSAREEAREAAFGWNQLATLYFFRGDPARTLAAVLRGLDAATRGGTAPAIVQASASLGFVLGTARLRRLARHYFGRAQQTAAQAGDVRGRANTLYLEAMLAIGLGDWPVTQRLGAEAAALFESIGDSHEAEIAHTIVAHGFYYAGRLDEAEAAIDRVEATAAGRQHAQHLGWTRFMRARTLLLRGADDEALALCESARTLIAHLPDTPSNVMLDGTLARAALATGAIDVALAACRRLAARMQAGEWPATGQCIDGIAGAAEVLLRIREHHPDAGPVAAEVETVMRTLRQFAWLFPIAGPALQRARARLLQTEGRRAAAARAWRRSLRDARRLAMPLEEALAHLDQARMLDDPAARHRALDRARALVEALGCPALLGESGSPRAGDSADRTA